MPIPPPWEEVEDQFRQAEPNGDMAVWRRRYETQRNLAIERSTRVGDTESSGTYALRRVIPFASPIYNFADTVGYARASQRVNAAEPLTGDIARVADYERQQQRDEERGLGGQVLSGLAHVPAMIGEAMVGGIALRGVGIGATTGARAIASAPSLLSSAGLRTAISSMGSRVLTTAAQTATMPSMYLDAWGQRAAAAGRDPMTFPSVIQDLPPAFALGMVQVAILGRLGSVGNSITGSGVLPTIARIGVRTATGMTEQAGADVLAGALDEVLPETYQLRTRYGLLGNAFRGEWGEAMKHATVQAATFAAFSAFHTVTEKPPEAVPQARQVVPPHPAEVMAGYQRALNGLAKQGIPKEAAGKELNRVFDYMALELEALPTMTREQAREALAPLELKGPMAEFGEWLVERLPERSIAETAPEPSAAETQWMGPEARERPEEARGRESVRDADQPPLDPAFEQNRPPQQWMGPEARERTGRESVREADRPSLDPVFERAQEAAEPVVDTPAPQYQRDLVRSEIIRVEAKEPKADPVQRVVNAMINAPRMHEGREPALEVWRSLSKKDSKLVEEALGAPLERFEEQPGLLDDRIASVYLAAQNEGKAVPRAAASAARTTRPGRESLLGLFEQSVLAESGQGERPDHEVILQSVAKFGNLSERYRDILQQRLKGLSFEEIASNMGLNNKQRAEQIFTRALEKLPIPPEGREWLMRVAEAAEKNLREETSVSTRSGEAAKTTAKLDQDVPETFANEKVTKARKKIAELTEQFLNEADPAKQDKIVQQIKKATDDAMAAGYLFHEPGAAGLPTGTLGGTLDPFTLIATQNKMFDNVNYIEKLVPGSRTALAAALLHPEAIVTKKLAAGDPLINLEENAHIFSVRNKFPANPELLPANVREGFRQFWDANAPMNKRTILEGFAQWFVGRSTGRLPYLTAEQRAASEFAENWIKEKGFAEQANKLQKLYANLPSTGVGQAAGLMSATGRMPEPIQNAREQAVDWWTRAKEWFIDNVDTNLGVLHRLQKESPLKARVGEDAVTVYDRLMFADKVTAGEFESQGVHTMLDGKQIVIGRPFGKPGEKGSILETLTNADLAPVIGDLSKFDVYATSRHVLDEHVRGRPVVPEAQLPVFERAMQEFVADRAFTQRAEEAANRLTDAYNSTLLALASPDIHFLSEAKAKSLIEARPTYVRLARVIADKGFDSAILKARTGESGEAIVSPLVSYQHRLRVTASLLNEQIRRNSVVQYLLAPGAGKYGIAFEQKLTAAGELRVKEVAERLGLADADVAAILKEMGPEATQYFTTTPWPKDGSNPTWYWRGPDGKETSFRIKDRAFYELITGQQGDANSFVQLIRGISNFGVGEIKPFRMIATAVQKGATTFGIGFQVRNLSLMRDPLTFLSNTTDLASAGKLPEAYKRVFAYEIAMAKGEVSQDVFMNLYKKMRGDENRLLAFDKQAPELIYDRLREKGPIGKVLSGAGEILKHYVNITGAGENAPRLLEFQTFLEKHGWTAERLTREEPPWHLVQAGMLAAAEVTVPFQRTGIITREINAIQPFFGAQVAGISKAIRNWQVNPRGAAIAVAGVLSLRLLHWLAFHDENWFKELSAHDRFNNFVVPIPGMGLRRLPGPRDLQVPIGGALVTMLDAANRQNPDVAGLVAQSIGAIAPRPPLTPAGNVSTELMRNVDWSGQRIVPRRDEDLPAMHNLVEHQAPYAASQLTGGRGELSLRGTGLVPFSEVRNANRSVEEYYDALHALEAERTLIRRQGRVFPRERDYQVLHMIEQRMQQLSRESRGEHRAGAQTIQRERPGDERLRSIREEQNRLARRVLEMVR